MKGLLLAAGKGTRLYPATLPVCKPLLPVYDKPLLYFPLAVLLQAGVRDIMIIVPPGERHPFENLLGDGSRFGVSISYKSQLVPRGIADAFLVGEEFIGGDEVCLVLGDNIFYGPGLDRLLAQARAQRQGATVFGYWVRDPRPFGVVEFDAQGRAVSIEEKPTQPKSNYIVPGLYFYDNQVVRIAHGLQPSPRGELEITAVNNAYLEQGRLQVAALPQDFTWLDAGTADSLLEAANTVQRLEKQEKRQIACVEEIAWRQGWISLDQLRRSGEKFKSTPYGQYILSLPDEK